MAKLRKVYLAGPFSSKEQLATIETLERLIIGTGLDLSSPRSRSPSALTDAQRADKEIAARTFDNHIGAFLKTDIMVVVLDDNDPGAMFELGMAYAVRSNTWPNYVIITYSETKPPSNVMIRQGADAHASSLEELAHYLERARMGVPMSVGTIPTKDTL